MSRVPAVFAALCVGLSAVASLTAVRARQAASVPSLKPLVPAAAGSIASNPDAFYGQNVTITAAVDRVVSPTSFTVDQDTKTSGAGEVLVLVPVLNAPLAVNTYVTIIGEVVRHEGRPAIQATAVITAAMVDIAKRLPPPMTPDEEAFDRVMKRISPAFSALRQAVAAGAGGGAKTEGTLKVEAAMLMQAFADTEAFWKRRDKADAVKWAVDARAQAEILERAIAAGTSDGARAAVTALQQTCSACHDKYRERQDDGSYRIRMGS